MTCTVLSEADLRYMLLTGRVPSHHLSRLTDGQNGFGLTSVLKTLTDDHRIFDEILMDMWILYVYLLKASTPSFPSKSKSYAVITWGCRIVAHYGFVILRQSSNIVLPVAEWLTLVKPLFAGLRLSRFLNFSSPPILKSYGTSWLGPERESFLVCVLRNCQTVQSI